QKDGQVTLSGDIELISKHMRSYDIERRSLRSVPAEALTRSTPECRYMVTDSDGRVVLAGQVALAEDASFRVDLRGRLPSCPFTMQAKIAVKGNTTATDIKRIPIVMSSQR